MNPFSKTPINILESQRIHKDSSTTHLSARFKRLHVLLLSVALIAVAFYSVSSGPAVRARVKTLFASPPEAIVNAAPDERGGALMTAQLAVLDNKLFNNSMGVFPALLQAGTATVTTYASDCSTPKTVFGPGETICAKVTGSAAGFRLIWSNANQNAVQNTTIGSTNTFALSSTPSLGDWRVIVYEPFGGTVQTVTSFTVNDAANPVSDLAISTTPLSGSVAAGGQVLFGLQVTNYGPSTATNAQLADALPANTSFVSFAQFSGPSFTCSAPVNDTTNCTIGSLGRGETATFIATFQVDNGTSSGTGITNTATISSATTEQNNLNNSADATAKVAPTACVLTPPANISVDAASGQAGATVTYASPTAAGDCGQPSTGSAGETIQPISCTPASGSFFPLGTTTVTCAGQTGGAATFQVTVNNPGGGLTISLNGDNPLTHECGTNFGDPGATAFNGANQSVPVTISGRTIDRSTPSGTYTLTYTATDGTNSVSTTRTVNVADSQAPKITVEGANPYRILQGSCSPYVDPGASAADDCGGSVGVSSSISGPNGLTSVDPNTPGTYTVTYTATDGSHPATATRTVLVGNFPQGEVDQPASSAVPPTITLNGDNQMTVECGSAFTDPGATAAVCGGSVPVITSGTVDSHTPGNYTLTYTATSGSLSAEATRSVTVEDTASPTITLAGANPLIVECHTSFTDPGATAHDACAGDSPATASGTVDPDTVGSYTITYNATDPSGHPATPVTRTVSVVDTTPPTITVNGGDATDHSITVECHTSFTDPGATANDSCAGSVTVIASGTVDVNTPGNYSIIYSATDGTNSASQTRTVHVVDTTPPTITLNGDSSVTVECHTSFTDPGASASDSCAGSAPVTVSGSFNVNTPGTYTLNYTANDAAGNQSPTLTRTVMVVDTLPPSIALNGASPMTVECHTAFSDPGATASDACAGDLTSAITETGSVNPNVVGSYALTYSVSDGQGHNASVSRTVNVVDTIAPTINLNGQNISFWPPNHSYRTINVTDLVASVTDSCDTTLAVGSVVISKVTSDETENGDGDGNTFNDIVLAANCKSVQLRAERNGSGNGRVYTITFKVKDASGNVTTATATVKVPRNVNGVVVDDGPHYTVNGNCP